MKRLTAAAIWIVLTISVAGAEEVIFAPSARDQATQGFEQDTLDFVVDPELFGQIAGTTLVVDLDGREYGDPLGTVGLRAAMALRPGGGFAPHFVVAYDGSGTTGAADPLVNIELTRTGFDLATGNYATINEAVNTLTVSSATSTQALSGLFGIPLGENAGIALEGTWIYDRYADTAQDYANDYTNTASVTPSALSAKGDLTDSAVNLMRNQDNRVAIEVEFGLAPGVFGVAASLGVSLENLIGASDFWIETVHTYLGGLDPTLEDGFDITESLGAFYLPGGLSARFQMTSDVVDHPATISIGLDTLTTIPGGTDWRLEVPLVANLALHPLQSATDRTTIVTLNEASGIEATRSVTSWVTTLDSPLDLRVDAGARIRGTLRPAENTAFHLGAAVVPFLHVYRHTMSQTKTIRTQNDGDGDGAYTTAGVDTDTLYTESGYTRTYALTQVGGSVELPVAVSWSPIPALTFHAGTTTTFDLTVDSTSSLVEGDALFLYEAFTDNLDSANSYAERQRDGSNSQTTPAIDVSATYSFDVAGNFGFTLVLAPGLTVGAIAQTQGLAFDAFSLTCTYVPGGTP